MKFAFPIGTPDTMGPMMAYQGDIDKIVENLKAIGYSGLELFVREPKDIDIISFSKLIERSGLDVPVIGTGSVVNEDKLTLTDKKPEIRKAAIKRIKEIIDFAELFGAQVSVGKVRGDIDLEQKEKSWEWMRQALYELCEYGYQKGININIEPQNKTIINNLNSTVETLEWIESIDLPNLYIMLDVYHMNIEDKSIIESLMKAKEKNIHMHFADDNRGVPGSGNINFMEIMETLKTLDYKGYISMEISQLPDSFTAAKKSLEYMNSIYRKTL